MKSFREIDKLVQYLDQEEVGKPGIAAYCSVLKDNEEIIDLLRLLERVNPCGQEYYLRQGIIMVSYIHDLNLLNFTKRFSLKAKVRIIGLPVSLSLSGILSKKGANAIEIEANKVTVKEVLEKLDGLSLVLNSEIDISMGNRTLSAFVFQNRFSDFQAYLDALRASYRRKICRALENGKYLEFLPIPPREFTKHHYALYLSIMERTENPLEKLPIAYFREYDADIFEVRNKIGCLVGFVQMKSAGSTLYFMFCGFRKDEVGFKKSKTAPVENKKKADEELNHIDLYYNMLLFIIRYGIENGYESIEMGQTSEETKLKLGCVEMDRYLCLHHGNPIVNTIMKALSARFSYKGYPIKHHVFKEEKLCADAVIVRETG